MALQIFNNKKRLVMAKFRKPYSEKEKEELRKIKSLPGKSKKRSEAMTLFCEKWNRTRASLYPAMSTLRKKRKKNGNGHTEPKLATKAPVQFRIKYKSVTVEDGHLVFEI